MRDNFKLSSWNESSMVAMSLSEVSSFSRVFASDSTPALTCCSCCCCDDSVLRLKLERNKQKI